MIWIGGKFSTHMLEWADQWPELLTIFSGLIKLIFTTAY